jgi:hypothetical protein
MSSAEHQRWAAVAACGGEIGINHVVSTYRRRGSAAFFAPYLAALPPQPPCPWLLPPGELDDALAKLGAAEAAALPCCRDAVLHVQPYRVGEEDMLCAGSAGDCIKHRLAGTHQRCRCAALGCNDVMPLEWLMQAEVV